MSAMPSTVPSRQFKAIEGTAAAYAQKRLPAGTLWNVKNASGHNDVYGTPVHVSQRMTMHAARNTILIDAKDKEPAVEWLERTSFTTRRLRRKLKDYPDKKLYMISVK